LVGRYDSLCLAPPSDIQADKFGYYTITFVNDKCLSKSDVWYIFSKFGTVACVNGTFDCKKGRVFVSYAGGIERLGDNADHKGVPPPGLQEQHGAQERLQYCDESEGE
jgi:hypothetical protein